jgi:hypothetical protein
VVQPAAGVTDGAGKGNEDEIWTDERVKSLVDTCEDGMKVLREIQAAGHLGHKAVEIERAGQGLVGKCVAMGMVS